ncbi:MAG: hypothetical protein HQK96_15870 [Nitrospirae bacterium]|nr:hypothetical protein [Nitrospirota bacterium]
MFSLESDNLTIHKCAEGMKDERIEEIVNEINSIFKKNTFSTLSANERIHLHQLTRNLSIKNGIEMVKEDTISNDMLDALNEGSLMFPWDINEYELFFHLQEFNHR